MTPGAPAASALAAGAGVGSFEIKINLDTQIINRHARADIIKYLKCAASLQKQAAVRSAQDLPTRP